MFHTGLKKTNFSSILKKRNTCFLVQRLKISGDAEDFSVTKDGTPIKFSTVFKYLGVMLDNNLTFNEHINCVVAKVSRN